MTTFKEIQGRNIRSYTTNPDNPLEGQMWYNQTESKLKGVTASGAWSSVSPSVNGGSSRIGFGIQTAGIAAGGSTAPGNQTTVEEYNGSGWSTETALPVSRQDGGGAGTTTAGLVWCGEGPAKLNTTQEYNGSSWTTTGNYPITARGVRGSGTQTAAIGDGGDTPAPAASNVSAEYNGSTWTAGNNLPDNRIAAATSGPQTAALATTGKTDVPNPTVSNLNTSYDGTSWTAETVYPLSLRQAVSTGTSSAANLVAGGVGDAPFGSATTKANVWNGSSWTAVGDLGTKSTHGNGAGSSTASYINSGAQDYPSYPGVTQEYNFSTNIITAAAWASGGTLNTARQRTGGFGAAQTSAVTAAGATAPPASALNKTEEYNGTSWSEVNNVNTARFNMTAFGTEPAGVLAGVGTPSVTYGGTTEEYNGTTWTTVNPYAAPGANYRSSNGTLTAGLLAGGVSPAPAEMTNAVEEYDGTNWSTGNNLPQYQAYNNQAGSQTAAINGGGSAGPAAPGPVSANAISLEYDGTNWTAGPNGNLYSDRTASFNGGSGTQTAAMFVGGDGVGTTTYDGTTFASAPTVAAARGDTSAAGQAPAATATIFAGSPVPSVGGTTLEFSEETTSVNIVDITTS